MQKPRIFNFDGDDSLETRTVINGNSTNLIRLSNIKYKWTNKYYDTMDSQFWTPKVVDMTGEDLKYRKLMYEVQNTYDRTISFLIFLDSIQVTNLPHIHLHITSPEIKNVLAYQIYQESNHARTYQYMLESTVNAEKIDEIYYIWKTQKELSERCKYIARIYEDYMEDPESEEKFVKVIVANYILEGLYFYLSFNFFFNLGWNSQLSATIDQIRYIKKDEENHINIFCNIIKDLEIVEDENYRKIIVSLFNQAVNNEIKWSIFNFKDILGFNENSIVEYVKNRANNLLKNIGMKPLYPGFNKNPYSFLETGSVKGNFFEGKVTEYIKAESLSGWNDLKSLEIDLENL